MTSHTATNTEIVKEYDVLIADYNQKIILEEEFLRKTKEEIKNLDEENYNSNISAAGIRDSFNYHDENGKKVYESMLASINRNLEKIGKLDAKIIIRENLVSVYKTQISLYRLSAKGARSVKNNELVRIEFFPLCLILGIIALKCRQYSMTFMSAGEKGMILPEFPHVKDSKICIAQYTL